MTLIWAVLYIPLASGNTGILKRQMPTMEACHQYQAAMAEAYPKQPVPVCMWNLEGSKET